MLSSATGIKTNWQWLVDSEDNVRHMTIWDVNHALILQVVEWVNMLIWVVADTYFSNKPFVQYLMDKDRIWTSILSLNRPWYDIRRYALVKLVFADFAISGGPAKNDDVRETLLDMIA